MKPLRPTQIAWREGFARGWEAYESVHLDNSDRSAFKNPFVGGDPVANCRKQGFVQGMNNAETWYLGLADAVDASFGDGFYQTERPRPCIDSNNDNAVNFRNLHLKW